MVNDSQSVSSNGLGFQMPEYLDLDLSTYSTTYGKFTLQPLERGFGITIGNAFRRVLLSSLPGAAIVSIRIGGVLHEFSTIKGVKEDVTEIVLNLRQVRLKMLTRKVDKAQLHLKGPMEFTARDLEKASREFEVINPDLHIATLNEDAEFDFEFTARVGRGYVPAEENRHPDAPIGTIPLDALFNPVRKVNFTVENTRIGQRVDFDKLTLEVWTDGTITPDEALSRAGRILRDHIQIFIDFALPPVVREETETEEDRIRIRRILLKPVDEMDLSVRAANCLKEARIRTIAELVAKEEKELLSYRNFGRKSLDELKDMLEMMGLHFGFDVEKYLGPGYLLKR